MAEKPRSRSPQGNTVRLTRPKATPAQMDPPPLEDLPARLGNRAVVSRRARPSAPAETKADQTTAPAKPSKAAKPAKPAKATKGVKAEEKPEVATAKVPVVAAAPAAGSVPPTSVGISTAAPTHPPGPVAQDRRLVRSANERHALIERAAFFRAEGRGFQHGHDQTDWFAAEREIDLTYRFV